MARLPNPLVAHAKANGVHYTPSNLAAFLADATARALNPQTDAIHVLDPACGDGELLAAFVEAVPANLQKRLILEGFETDAKAVQRARRHLAQTGASDVLLINEDFLGNRFNKKRPKFDVVIANPPYVRTQVLGARVARDLADRFGLSGKVDLYQAFAIRMASVLRSGGILGLLTSNRFLTIKSGSELRRLLRDEFELLSIHDLGDTRLFSAAVLPAIVIARKGKGSTPHVVTFDRVYQQSSKGTFLTDWHGTILEALREPDVCGGVRTSEGAFRIERGVLGADNDHWTLTTPEATAWLEAVRQRQANTFGGVANVRVGIKTTADEVFIRDDWDQLSRQMMPESSLLRPLLTHEEADRWVAKSCLPKRVLYPHETVNGRRVAVDLKEYPRAAAYLKSHYARLCRRRYVIDSGRQWYEIWVPHQPGDWALPKLVCPDIAETPRFLYDGSGTIVNGDCYWITLKPEMDENWLLLMLAVANSTFITKFYDMVFHNKLYAGRRRFMTQYVARFPLPDVRSKLGNAIVERTKRLLDCGGSAPTKERKLDEMVWQAFGVKRS